MMVVISYRASYEDECTEERCCGHTKPSALSVNRFDTLNDAADYITHSLTYDRNAPCAHVVLTSWKALQDLPSDALDTFTGTSSVIVYTGYYDDDEVGADEGLTTTLGGMVQERLDAIDRDEARIKEERDRQTYLRLKDRFEGHGATT